MADRGAELERARDEGQSQLEVALGAVFELQMRIARECERDRARESECEREQKPVHVEASSALRPMPASTTRDVGTATEPVEAGGLGQRASGVGRAQPGAGKRTRRRGPWGSSALQAAPASERGSGVGVARTTSESKRSEQRAGAGDMPAAAAARDSQTPAAAAALAAPVPAESDPGELRSLRDALSIASQSLAAQERERERLLASAAQLERERDALRLECDSLRATLTVAPATPLSPPPRSDRLVRRATSRLRRSAAAAAFAAWLLLLPVCLRPRAA